MSRETELLDLATSALESLVAVKNHKETCGKNGAYLDMRDAAWEKANKAIAEIKDKADKPVAKEKTAYSHLSDLEMAIRIRMLSPDAPDHEAVCIEARDRIVYLIQEVKRLNARVRELEHPLYISSVNK